MRDSRNSDQKAEQVNVLLFDDFSNHCLANAIEPFRAANSLSHKVLYQWRFYTPQGTSVASSSGLQISPDGPISDARGEMLIVMPSYRFRSHAVWDNTRKLKAAATRHKILVGLDTGSWLLANAGLLDGYRATIHWEELTPFAEAFPDVQAARERFVIDGDRITCSGAMATYDLVLHLISKAHGPFLAMEVEQLFMSIGSAGTRGSAPNPTGRIVQKAIVVMQENLEEPLRLADVAKRAGATQKTLEQRMQLEMKATPQSVYRRLRLILARKLALETDHPVAEIAGRCGYENASAMTRAFKAEFRVTLRDLRKQAG
jgi:transcriptional regulator GlxA family with amidase domain